MKDEEGPRSGCPQVRLEAFKGASGRGCGLACGIRSGAYVATLAEVEVDRSTGKVQVKRVVHAQDMGLVINPEGAKQQVEGSIIMGLGYALREEIHFKNGEIFDLNFDTYQIPRFSWAPGNRDRTHRGGFSPQGGGEPAIVCVGAVMANAIFDAIGVRLYQLPMTPERILAGNEQVMGVSLNRLCPKGLRELTPNT